MERGCKGGDLILYLGPVEHSQLSLLMVLVNGGHLELFPVPNICKMNRTPFHEASVNGANIFCVILVAGRQTNKMCRLLDGGKFT